MAGQTDTLIAAILEDIDAGRLAPGQEIDEAALAARHSVSRTPIREAYIQLEASGLIRRLPRKGAVLFKPTLEEFLAIQEVHAQLEGQAAGLAARRISPVLREQLHAVVAGCEAHASQKGDADPDGYYQLNLRFHETVALGAANPFLVEMTRDDHNTGFTLGTHIATSQHHPEMTHAFIGALTEELRQDMGPEVYARAQESLTQKVDQPALAEAIARFFEAARAA